MQSQTRKLPPETEIVQIIASNRFQIAPKTLNSEFEVDSGYGIADIVFFNFDEEQAKKRQLAGFPSIQSYEVLETLSLVNKLPEDIINITYLYNNLPYSEKIFRKKILSYLIENQIAENIDNTYLKFNFQYKYSVQEIVAIEAKISNWKRGLYQAYRYRQYADFSYLALHKKFIPSALANIDLFDQLNVGLIEVDDEFADVRKLFVPKRNDLSINEKFKIIACEDILFKKGFISHSN